MEDIAYGLKPLIMMSIVLWQVSFAFLCVAVIVNYMRNGEKAVSMASPAVVSILFHGMAQRHGEQFPVSMPAEDFVVLGFIYAAFVILHVVLVTQAFRASNQDA